MTSYVPWIKSSRAIVLLSLAVVLLAVAFWIFYLPTSSRLDEVPLPPLPDLSGQPQVLVDYLQQMNNGAMNSPRSAEAIGALALAYQSNFFYDEAKQCE